MKTTTAHPDLATLESKVTLLVNSARGLMLDPVGDPPGEEELTAHADLCEEIKAMVKRTVEAWPDRTGK